MQGYIIHTQNQKNEDLIVRILTKNEIKTLYRFYGARHSIVHIGRKIDFIQENNGIFMPKLRNVFHIGFNWEREEERLYIWQRFIGLLHQHLKDIYTIDQAYFEILDFGAQKLCAQNPKRVVLEMYAQILRYEGRKPTNMHCILCAQLLTNPPPLDFAPEELLLGRYNKPFSGKSNTLNDNPASNVQINVTRGFLGAHTECVYGEMFDYDKLQSFLESASTIELDDEEVQRAYQVLLLGL